MIKKRNVVLYLDEELVAKTRELGFNLSRTFENHLKMLIIRFQNVYTQKNCEKCVVGSPGEIRTPVSGSRARRSNANDHEAQVIRTDNVYRKSGKLNLGKDFGGYHQGTVGSNPRLAPQTHPCALTCSLLGI